MLLPEFVILNLHLYSVDTLYNSILEFHFTSKIVSSAKYTDPMDHVQLQYVHNVNDVHNVHECTFMIFGPPRAPRPPPIKFVNYL